MNKKSKISRRSIIKGGFLTAGAGVAMFLAGGITSSEAKETPKGKPKSKNLEYDVVIVG